jgi:hypothetical protein
MSASQGLTATASLNNIGYIQSAGAPANISLSGVMNFTGALTNGTSTITIPGMTSTGVTLLTYIHPTGGGAGQFIVTATNGTNECRISTGQVTAAGESLAWLTNKLQ